VRRYPSGWPSRTGPRFYPTVDVPGLVFWHNPETATGLGAAGFSVPDTAGAVADNGAQATLAKQPTRVDSGNGVNVFRFVTGSAQTYTIVDNSADLRFTGDGYWGFHFKLGAAAGDGDHNIIAQSGSTERLLIRANKAGANASIRAYLGDNEASEAFFNTTTAVLQAGAFFECLYKADGATNALKWRMFMGGATQTVGFPSGAIPASLPAGNATSMFIGSKNDAAHMLADLGNVYIANQCPAGSLNATLGAYRRPGW
jgi:hypothetical protein